MKRFFELLVVIAFAAMLVGFFRDGDYNLRIISHQVASGETVWEIASFYMADQAKIRDVRELVWAIKEQNHLTNYRIQPGQVLEIPLWQRPEK